MPGARPADHRRRRKGADNPCLKALRMQRWSDSDRDFGLDVRMRFVAYQLEIFELEIEQVGDRRIQFHLRQWVLELYML